MRILIFIVGIVIVFIVIINVFLKPASKVNMPSYVSSVNTEALNDNEGDNDNISSHTYSNKTYAQLEKKSEKLKIHRAESSGESYVTDIFTTSNNKTQQNKSTNNLASNDMSPKEFNHNQEQQNKKNTQVRINKNSKRIAQSETENIYATNTDSTNSIESGMAENVKQMVKQWGQSFQITTVGSLANTDKNTGIKSSLNNGPVIFKAGQILFAVIDSAVNSDQEGTPVLATVSTGKLKGAKLLGSFRRENSKLVIKFDRLSIPSESKSIPINAYAVDDKSAQAAVASSVNNHYMLRYGGLFAAGFLQGFGNYFSNYQQNNYRPNYGPWQPATVYPSPSVNDAVYAGLGGVGNALSNSARAEFNKPPTIKLDQGTGVGVLIMADVHAPVDTHLQGDTNYENI